ncbi:potassium transporter 4-like [Hibiscus syriacus]|uniref:potassium transporter 4-like n=1 Tax=Hibiscus syriacus TaxID=106335 RepID=UPI001923C49E|nr:potassium transporter 4-like [Hibiscus syriacus]
MDPDSDSAPPKHLFAYTCLTLSLLQLSWVNLSRNLILAYQSLGVVYGDFSTSPLYVYSSTFIGKLQNHQNEDAILGALSLIFWTLTLIPLCKYVFILLYVDDNGEGGTFALYSLLCRHAKFSLLPNQHAADEEISAYKYGPSTQSNASFLKRFLEKNKTARMGLLIVVLFAASMVIGDGVLTAAMSVLSSMPGLLNSGQKLSKGVLLFLDCAILVSLFALQHIGTHRVSFMFAPIVLLWLILIFCVGLYNIIHWNPHILKAISPFYIIKFFKETGKDGCISLGGILLSITGTEYMYADLGHFTAISIRIAFVFAIYPSLVVQYMGQAAFLSRHLDAIPNCFFRSVPDSVYWPIYVVSTLAAVVGSQSIITATFSVIKQCHALGCFPRVKIVHTSKHIYGQIYIPEINWILLVLALLITIGFHDTTSIGNAYGLTTVTLMFITTFLMSLVIAFVWHKSIWLAGMFFLFFGFIEGVYLSAALMKVQQGGWVPLVLSFIFMMVMYIWHYGTGKKYDFDMHNKVSLKWLLGLGPSLGIARVPGVGLIYSELVTGVPAIFSHFVTNLPAFHKVLVFVCVKSVPVPFVPSHERFIIGRVCPRPYRMYRCILRYGYKDIQRDNGDFENQLIQRIAEFIKLEAEDPHYHDGRMVVTSSTSIRSIIITEEDDIIDSSTIQSSESSILHSLESVYDEENLPFRQRQLRFQVPAKQKMDPAVREELMDLIEAQEAGFAYIMGHSCVKARRSSSVLKKFVIDVAYAFLRTNCRGPAVELNIPHISLVEVGMIYYV